MAVYLKVVVKGTAGNPIQDARLTAEGYTDLTDAQGIAMVGLPDTYDEQWVEYQVTKSGYQSASGSAQLTRRGIQTKWVTLATEEEPPPPPTEVTLTIIVQDKDTGAGIGGAIITVDGRITKTDASGKATYISLSPRTYSIRVVHDPDYFEYRADVSVLEDQTLIIELEPTGIEPPPPPAKARLAVYVMDDLTKRAVSGAQVYVDTIMRETDWTGIAEFIDLPTKTYVVTVVRKGYQTATVTINLIESTMITVISQRVPTSEAAKQLAREHGIAVEELPPGTTDLILLRYDGPVMATGSVWEQIFNEVYDKVKKDFPEVDILRLMGFGNYVMVAARGSPIAPIIIGAIALIAAVAIAVTVVIAIPKLIDIYATDQYIKIREQTNWRIKEILEDPTLTPEQKAALIQEALEKDVLPPSILGQIKWVLIAGAALVGAYAGYRLIAGRKKRK